jgi:DNA repair exonuclease SbcCD ATPase subunit
MLIKKIKATNFKTYLNLDLDISVEQDKPIILIGGANGGGKTHLKNLTIFESLKEVFRRTDVTGYLKRQNYAT